MSVTLIFVPGENALLHSVVVSDGEIVRHGRARETRDGLLPNDSLSLVIDNIVNDVRAEQAPRKENGLAGFGIVLHTKNRISSEPPN